MADQEHYDFHYQPTGSGAISGQQVLEQTEDAINELGDYVYDNVGGAMDVAQEALETAQNAEHDAQTALDTANSFSDAIQSAQQDASTALSTAQTAQTTATNANATAIQASQDASSAVTTANNASGQVSTLSGTVTALGQRVTTAEGNIGQNTSDITALTTRVGTAEGNITTLQNDVTIAQGNASSAMATAGTVKQQSYVLRYSSTVLVASSTNSNALLDNTDNLKVGDKVIDSSGVIYSVTVIDTANSTFTIGTSLIDLAQDGNVVHKSGNETIAGVKTFSNNIQCFGDSDAKSIIFKTPLATYESTNTVGDSTRIQFLDKNNNPISYIRQRKLTNGNTDISLNISNTDSNNQPIEATLNFVLDSSNDPRLSPGIDNTISLGRPTFRYKSVYATNYYYGSNNVEFSQKFVTTDTAQTVSGSKTYNDLQIIGYGTQYKGARNAYILPEFVAGYSGLCITTLSFAQTVKIGNFVLDANNKPTLDTSKGYIQVATGENNGVNACILEPRNTTSSSLGTSSNKWNVINGLEPSSLSLPSGNANDVIDISSYITALDGTSNSYTVPANGWISITVSNCSGVQAFITGLWGHQVIRPSAGAIRFLMPILKDKTANILIFGGNIDYARFIPCQGNV